jgi:peptide/nickel transport system permease protein
VLAFVVRRLVLLVVALVVASVVVFALLRLLPGDLAAVIAGPQAPPERVDAIREQLGLDRPLVEQYLEWMGGVLQGDFGTSVVSGTSVADEMRDKLAITGPLVLASTVLSLLVAVPIGTWAAVRRQRPDGVAVNALSQVGIAMPSFLVGLALIIVFAVRLGWFPPNGFPRQGWDEPGRAVRSLVLPVLTLALAQGAVLVRFVRSATLDVLQQDFMRTARATGLTFRRAFVRHGIRNASVPIISILGVQIASLLAGVVVIERVFALPGIGQMLVGDIGDRDLEKVQGTVLLLTVIVLVIGFVVDVLARLIDPRLRDATT